MREGDRRVGGLLSKVVGAGYGKEVGFKGCFKGILSFRQSDGKGEVVPVLLCEVAKIMAIVLSGFWVLLY